MQEKVAVIDFIRTPLKHAWQTFSSNLIPSIALIVLIDAFLFPYAHWAEEAAPEAIATGMYTTLILIGLFGIICLLITFWGFSSATYLAHNQQTPVKTMFTQGLKLLPNYIWTIKLLGIQTLGGLIILIVPGLKWGLEGILSPAVCVAEGTCGIKALQTSKSLVRPHWFAVIVSLLVTLVIFMAPNIAFEAILGVADLTLPTIINDFTHSIISTPIFVFNVYYHYHLYRFASENTPKLNS